MHPYKVAIPLFIKILIKGLERELISVRRDYENELALKEQEIQRLVNSSSVQRTLGYHLFYFLSLYLSFSLSLSISLSLSLSLSLCVSLSICFSSSLCVRISLSCSLLLRLCLYLSTYLFLYFSLFLFSKSGVVRLL